MSFTCALGEPEDRPLVVEVPHAGLLIPKAFEDELTGDPRTDADLYVDKLCADAPAYGATLLVAHLSRWVVDLNRSAEDIDPALFDPALASSALPRGAVWRVAMNGRALVRHRCTQEEIETRLDAYYAPYHRALDEEIARCRAKHGHAIVLAAHSMPSSTKRTRGDARPPRADVVPGTRGRTTASPAVIDTLDAVLRNAGLRVVHDDPYRGGHTTFRLGAPGNGVHVVQLELNRALYMDERTLEIDPVGFARVRAVLCQLFEALGDVTP